MMQKLIIVMAAVAFADAALACAAITKKGTLCKRSPAPGSAYCWQHGGGRQSSTTQHRDIEDYADSSHQNDASDQRPLVKTFLGVKIGAHAKMINGVTIKGEKKRKRVSIRPFRQFRKATITFSQDDRVAGVESRFTLSPKKTKDDAIKEAGEVLKTLESKLGVKFKRPDTVNFSSTPVYINGINFGAPSSPIVWDYEYSDPRTISIRVMVEKTQVENKALKGPNVPAKLDVWEVILSFRANNTNQPNWFDLVADGMELP